jgi:hypothetical protein
VHAEANPGESLPGKLANDSTTKLAADRVREVALSRPEGGVPISTESVEKRAAGMILARVAAHTLSAGLTLPNSLPRPVETMDEMRGNWDRMGAKDFFSREYFIDDLRWMVARLLGRSGPVGEALTTPDQMTPRATG